MIDGLIKSKIDPLWEAMATPLVKAGWSPNQVTFAGLVLIIAASLAYLWHGSPLIYGLMLSVSFAFDALDGAVARRRDMCSKSGGYFDAVVDRYQELMVLGTLAYMHDAWPLALLAFSGSILTSYAKARTAIEMPVSNENWPDFFERMERVIFISLVLIVAGLASNYSDAIVVIGLIIFAVLSHATALQRARRAWIMLKSNDQPRQ